jgi:hypothetical protein
MVRIVLFVYLFYHILTNYDQVFGGFNELSIRIINRSYVYQLIPFVDRLSRWTLLLVF